jgi:hypothetical protein
VSTDRKATRSNSTTMPAPATTRRVDSTTRTADRSRTRATRTQSAAVMSDRVARTAAQWDHLSADEMIPAETAMPWKVKAEKPAKTDPITNEVRNAVRRRSGGVCECCGAAPGTHLHHRQLRRSGDHTATNLLDLCATCHQRLHNRVRFALDQGMIVSAYDDPAMRELLYRGRDWVYLGANGELLTAAPS